MSIKAIAHSYWRRIKDGARTYDSVPNSVKEDVKILARQSVETGEITTEEYASIIGEDFVA